MIKVASLFSQILSTIRTAVNFDNLVARHEAEKNSKRYFTTRCSIYGLLHKKAHVKSILVCKLASGHFHAAAPSSVFFSEESRLS